MDPRNCMSLTKMMVIIDSDCNLQCQWWCRRESFFERLYKIEDICLQKNMVEIYFIMRRSEFYFCIITRHASEERVGLMLTSFTLLHLKLFCWIWQRARKKENKEVYWFIDGYPIILAMTTIFQNCAFVLLTANVQISFVLF